LAAALALGACTAQERAASRYASLDASLPAAPPQRAEATPVVVLPVWIGRPVALRERDGADGFAQAFTLSTPGHRGGRDDLVLVSSPREPAREAGPGGKPTEAGIRAELAGAFPGVAMQVVTRPSANAYGPYGLAIGRAGPARCLYAWQWIPAAPVREGGAPAPLSLRLRLCRDDLTLEAMAAAVTALRLVPRFAGEPVATAARRPARPPRAATADAAPRPPHRARPVERPGPAVVPASGAPSPAPASASSGPRYLGEAAEHGPASTGPLRSAQGGFAAIGLVTPGIVDAPSGPVAGLPPGAAILPPEATRGPAPRS
ncbi:cellulose biosynthesis protein BcsN, partial [Methylobacterium platani]